MTGLIVNEVDRLAPPQTPTAKKGLVNHPAGLIALITVVAINCLIYLDMATAFNALSFSTKQVYKYGLNFGPDWQAMLLPATYMHYDIMHIAMNMLALISFGHTVARRMGFLKFLLFYTLCGAFASLVSLAAHGADVVAVGASGAIAGVFGALFMVRFVGDRSVELKELGGVVFYNVIMAATVPFIDWQAHLGGFISGLILSIVFVPKYGMYVLVSVLMVIGVIGVIAS
jgi:membrane associated rhomboid family serine protease